MAKKKETPESPILKSICEYLDTCGYYFFRINNIPVFDPRRKCFRAMPKYSVKGVSDILVLHRGKAYFIEVKVPKVVDSTGNEIQKKTYQSKDQKKFEKNLIENDIFYTVARSVSDIDKIL